MSKKKALTLRQRLRRDAEAQLDSLVERAQEAMLPIVEDTSLEPALLMQLASQPTQGKTLRHDLITVLTNDKERALEKLYNNQMDLIQDDEEVAA